VLVQVGLVTVRPVEGVMVGITTEGIVIGVFRSKSVVVAVVVLVAVLVVMMVGSGDPAVADGVPIALLYLGSSVGYAYKRSTQDDPGRIVVVKGYSVCAARDTGTTTSEG